MVDSKKSDAMTGPEYAMTGFAGSRQPPGPSPEALEKLRADGILLADDDWQPAPRGEALPQQDLERAKRAENPSNSASSPSPSTPPSPTADRSATSSKAKAERKTRPAKKRGPRRRQRGGGYTLPPVAARRKGTRSCHFRLPSEIEGYLEELAQTHACTRTHVVCSAIQSEWERLHRAQTRAKKSRTSGAEQSGDGGDEQSDAE